MTVWLKWFESWRQARVDYTIVNLCVRLLRQLGALEGSGKGCITVRVLLQGG